MFDLKFNDELHILVYQNIYAKGTEKVKNIMWSDWCEWLTCPAISHDKYANGLAIYGDVSDGVDDETGEILQHHRKDENVMYRQVFSLDYDDIEEMDRFIENIKSKMHHFAYFMYSTFRHRDKHDENDKDLRPRFRLLIPIDDIVKPDEYSKYARALSKYIDETIDESCFTPIQLSALPTIKDNNKPYHWYINDAPFITREQLDKCVEKYQDEDEKIIVDYTKQYKKRDSEYWREIAFGVGEGERNKTLASLTGYLLRRYVDENLVFGLISAWAMTCNPPIEQSEVNKTFNSILKKDNQRAKKGGF